MSAENFFSDAYEATMRMTHLLLPYAERAMLEPDHGDLAPPEADTIV
jgi:hypothetical protein